MNQTLYEIMALFRKLEHMNFRAKMKHIVGVLEAQDLNFRA